ncbi:hypothetical protein HJ205_22845 [Vibrio parahaemolyticus]|nr:hypothetical protein [Vibrio parahaemolyticus]
MAFLVCVDFGVEVLRSGFGIVLLTP